MISGNAKTSIFLFLASFFLVGSVTAGINTISVGNTVFIGEEGLDITGALGGDTQIGWWAPGASITDSSPGFTILVTNPTQFFISPSEFGSHTGPWYHLDPSGRSNGTAFLVAEPYLDISIEDITVDTDVTNRWVPTDDQIGFRIETNLAQMALQRSSPALITIKVQSPGGSEYSSLVNASGIPTSIVEIPVSASPYHTNAIWNTGNRALYVPGTYSIWAECNVNRMNDNYAVTSRKTSVLNQEQNPLIGTIVPTTNPTIQMTITPAVTLTTASPSILTTQLPQQLATTTMIMTTIPVQTTATLPSTPSPSQTKSVGFEGTLAGAAMIIGLILSLKKE